MAIENSVDKKQAIAMPYSDDFPLSTMAQNAEIEELLISRLERELSDPSMSHNKIRIRLKEMSAINMEVTQQLNEYIKTGKSGALDPVVQKIGAANARVKAILNRAAEILNGSPSGAQQKNPALDTPSRKEEDQTMSTTTDKDYIDAKLLAATNQMIGDIKTANAIADGRLATIEARTDGRIASIEEKMIANFARFDATLHKSTADTVKWVAGTVLALGVIGISLMTFLLNNVAPKAPAAAPTPIIIYAQPTPAAPPTPQAPAAKQ